MKMSANAFPKNSLSVCISNIGSTGAPKSLNVWDTLSSSITRSISSARSILAREFVNWLRSANVLGHSQITYTSSSWNVLLHFKHTWFSRVTGRVNSRAITSTVFSRVTLHRHSLIPRVCIFSKDMIFNSRFPLKFGRDIDLVDTNY